MKKLEKFNISSNKVEYIPYNKLKLVNILLLVNKSLKPFFILGIFE